MKTVLIAEITEVCQVTPTPNYLQTDFFGDQHSLQSNAFFSMFCDIKEFTRRPHLGLFPRAESKPPMPYPEYMIRRLRPFDPQAIRLVIFDLDGTLIDSRLDLVHSVNAALRHIERPELPADVIASYVGDGAPVLIQRALGKEAGDEALIRRGLEFFLAYYREHKLDHTTVYEGMKETLAEIQRLTNPAIENAQKTNGKMRHLAVLSNKPVNPSRAILEALGLSSFFARIYGGNSFATKKPDPEGAKQLLVDLGVAPEEAAIVGDSHVDIKTGRNAGVWTVGVTYGFAPHTLNHADPDILVDSPAELSELFVS
ncbi:MAG TPA: HAD-IA family hydrolase [Candidatus Sulfotelmatobacter sp.]